jgi:hypothetical protein
VGIEPRALYMLGQCSTSWGTPLAFNFFFFETGSCHYLCPGWPWTTDPPASISGVAGITDMHHHAPHLTPGVFNQFSKYSHIHKQLQIELAKVSESCCIKLDWC